jgi:hypothetical protein
MQQRMTVLAAPQNRVGRIMDRMAFKGEKDVEWYAAGGSELQKEKARTGWDGEEWCQE